MNFQSALSVFKRSSFALKILLVTVISGGLLAATFVARRSIRDGQTLYRYQISAPMRTPYEGRRLIGWLTQNGFDVAGFNWQRGTIEVVTNDDGVKALTARGLRGAVQQQLVSGRAINAVDPNYLNPQKVEDQLKALNARFPNLTRLEQIGNSIEGRPIWALLVSNTPNPQDPAALEKPSIIFDGMHHAREVMTPEIVMDVAQTLLGAAQGRVRGAIDLLERWNIWVVPMLNVDGNNMVWSKDTWWRKNTHATQANIHGVDINRNYPFKWGSCRGSSQSPGAQDYRGEGAASEPETQALMRLAQMVRPAASLSYHSYSELVLYPYGCDNDLSGENALLEKIGKELAAMLPSDSGRKNYTPGTPWQILYAVDGDSMSYMHSEFGALAYTFEVNQEFQPPYSLRAPTLVKHRKAWQYFLSRMDTNMLKLKVVDGRTGRPSLAAIEISTIAHRFGEKVLQTNVAGNFFKVLDPGAYALRVTLPDGRKTEMKLEMQGMAQGLQVVVP